MATPRASAFEIASGARLVFGRPDIGTVAQGVWTPPRDDQGEIALSDVAQAMRMSAHKNRWMKVAGSIPNRILTQCQAKFGIDAASIQLGNDKFGNAVFKAWSSPIVDYVNWKLYWYASGGHENSSWDMLAVFDVRTMQFDCLQPPSLPVNPDHPEWNWSSDYINKVGGATFSSYKPAPPVGSKEALYGAYSILPNGSPASIHTYGDGVHDPVTGKLIRTIGRWFEIHPETGAKQFFYYKKNGNYFPTRVNSWAFLHKASRRIWFNGPGTDTDYYAYHWMHADAPSSGDEVNLNFIGAWLQGTSNASCLMDDDRVLMIGPGNGGVQRACIFDMAAADAAIQSGLTGAAVMNAAFRTLATGPGGAAEVAGGMADASDFPGIAYIPDWEQAIVVKTQEPANGLPSMTLLDIATQAQLPYDRQGNGCPLTPGSVWGGNLGHFHDLGLAFHIDMNSPTQPSMYVMFTGPK